MTNSDKAAVKSKGRLSLQIDQFREKLDIDISNHEGYIIGRSDNKSNYIPDIDLSAYNALDKGVSRRHAAFLHNDDHVLLLVDLSSVNGTFLNGERLQPETPSPIYIGDTIILGSLNMIVRDFVHARE